MNPAQHILLGSVRLYQVAVSPVFASLFGPLGFGCRFEPTCSGYALEAIRRHGAIRGVLLACRRLGRCHPWGGWGHDPVPDRFRFTSPEPRLANGPLAHDHESLAPLSSAPGHPASHAGRQMTT